MRETAVFEFFVSKLPEHRNFLVAAGLEQAIAYLEELAFSTAEIEWLAQIPPFQPGFVHWLENLRFTGDVNAKEGTVFLLTTDPAGDCAAAGGAACRDTPDQRAQRAQLSNDSRV